MAIKKTLRDLPRSPGVYIMKDGHGKVLYVGKAANIRKRVSSYFVAKKTSRRHEVLVSKIRDISHIPTQNEAEALIYEASLIKSLKPKYNIELKDDKNYPFLKITVSEQYPRLLVVRRIRPDGSRYFGPYTNAKLMRQALSPLKKFFPLRTCGVLPKKVCLNYHLGQCLGPCEKKTDEDTYRTAAEDLSLFLEGKKEELLKILSLRMKDSSTKKRFEDAAKIRDQIRALSSVPMIKKRFNADDALTELKEALGLKKIPKTIEAFDISNISGNKAVGSMVSFSNGKTDKDNYRRFRIKTVSGIDDYDMIREVIRRRYKRVSDGEIKAPDLVLIDGGKGHLNAACDELSLLGLNMPVISVAKEFEHIYAADKSEPLILPKTSRTLQLIQRIRDEAHRFAIGYHRLLRRKSALVSELDKIKGVGKKRRVLLIRHFKYADNVIGAKMEDLIKIKGLGRHAAREIVDHFKK